MGRQAERAQRDEQAAGRARSGPCERPLRRALTWHSSLERATLAVALMSPSRCIALPSCSTSTDACERPSSCCSKLRSPACLAASSAWENSRSETGSSSRASCCANTCGGGGGGVGRGGVVRAGAAVRVRACSRRRAPARSARLAHALPTALRSTRPALPCTRTSRLFWMSCWLKDSTMDATFGISLALSACTMASSSSAISGPLMRCPPTTLACAKSETRPLRRRPGEAAGRRGGVSAALWGRDGWRSVHIARLQARRGGGWGARHRPASGCRAGRVARLAAL